MRVKMRQRKKERNERGMPNNVLAHISILNLLLWRLKQSSLVTSEDQKSDTGKNGYLKNKNPVS